MRLTYDPKKNATNIAKHGFSLDAFEWLDFTQAIYREDTRKAYGEPRIWVFAPLFGRLCTAVFTPRGDTLRIINFRRTNRRDKEVV